MTDSRLSAAQELAALPIFVEVPNRELEEMLTRAQRRTYRTDETIFREGDPPTFLYYIISGEIGVSLTSDERRINVSRLSAGRLLGIHTIFDDGPQFLTGTALGPTVVLAIARSEMLTMLRRHPETLLRLGAVLARQIRDAARTVAEMQFLDLPVLLAKRILELARRAGMTGAGPFPVKITQEGLSELTGATRGGVNRALKRLEQLGMVETGRGRLVVLAADKLEELSRQGPSPVILSLS